MVIINGSRRVIKDIEKVLSKIEDDVVDSMMKWSKVVMKEAIEKAPIITGDLKTSGFIVSDLAVTNNEPTFSNENGHLAGAFLSRHKLMVSKQQRAASISKQFKMRLVTMGFSAFYAIKIHEDPVLEAKRIGNRRTGQWKFLESSFMGNKRSFRKFLASR